MSRGSILLAIITLLAAGALAVVTVAQLIADDPPVDLNGKPVALEPVDPALVEAQAPTIGDARLVVPSVDLDVPLGAISEADGTIVPPGFTAAYTIRNRGVGLDAADAGTVYAVTHSLRGGGVAPGNALIDVAAQRSAVDPGATIIADGVRYEVTAAKSYPKGELAGAPEVWANVPGRLVLITCLQVPAGTPSTENVVIFATMKTT